MCGIAGIYNPHDFARASAEFSGLLSMLDHRGPDARGQFASAERRVLLGHTRLSIIDLSAANNQPFRTEHTVTVFNGEIYNFPELRGELANAGIRFETAGDTEVVARGYEYWGPELFRRLRGMYAIGIFVSATGTLVLARDMFGIKPLYVVRRGNELRFASEIKALVPQRELAIDEPGLLDLLTLGYSLSSHCAFASVEQVPPGSVWQLSTDAVGKLRVTSETFKPLVLNSGACPSTADLRRALDTAVGEHLLADVPIAVSLSGGLDSSVVTALAAAQQADICAYTNTFDADHDYEVRYARQLADELGVPHRVLYSRVSDLEGLLREVMWYLEEPIPNPALLNSFFVGKALRDDGYKVVLIGEGADELFAGYPWHRLAIESPGREPARLFAGYATARSSADAARKYLTEAGRRALECRRRDQQHIFQRTLGESRGSRLEQFLHFDRRFQLASSQLQRVDRMLMRHAIEGRVPFLYDNLLSAACALPDDRKLATGGWWRRLAGRQAVRREKVCLAEAVRDALPRAILQRKKWGKTGTTNLFKTPALAQLPAVFHRMCTSADYADARKVLSHWIDFSLLAATCSRKTRLAVCQLLIAVEYFSLARTPHWNDCSYSVETLSAVPRSSRRAA